MTNNNSSYSKSLETLKGLGGALDGLKSLLKTGKKLPEVDESEKNFSVAESLDVEINSHTNEISNLTEDDFSTLELSDENMPSNSPLVETWSKDLFPVVKEEIEDLFPKFSGFWSHYQKDNDLNAAKSLVSVFHTFKGMFGFSGVNSLQQKALIIEKKFNSVVEFSKTYSKEDALEDLIPFFDEVNNVFEMDLELPQVVSLVEDGNEYWGERLYHVWILLKENKTSENILELLSCLKKLDVKSNISSYERIINYLENNVIHNGKLLLSPMASDLNDVISSLGLENKFLFEAEAEAEAEAPSLSLVLDEPLSENEIVEEVVELTTDSFADSFNFLELDDNIFSEESEEQKSSIIKDEDSILSSLGDYSSSSNSVDSWLADLDLEDFSEASEVFHPDSLEETVEDTLTASEAVLLIAQEEFNENAPKLLIEFNGLKSGQKEMALAFARTVHSVKGSAGALGGMKIRAMFHELENIAEDIQKFGIKDKNILNQIEDLLNKGLERFKNFLFEKDKQGNSDSVVQQKVQTVRVNSELLENIIKETNEARLLSSGLNENNNSFIQKLREFDENMSKISRMARDLEMQAETQIQSRKAQLAEKNEDFDPLEMDRFTLSQELSRLLIESVSDAQDLQRDMVRIASEQTTHLVYQDRSIAEIQEGLDKTRLVSVDKAINDRLHLTTTVAAKDAGKSVKFTIIGRNSLMDKSRLEEVVAPLEHIIRNSVAHGIEKPEDRIRAGKPVEGSIQLAVSKSAGRVIFVVEDDGAGLNVEKIRQKAIEKDLWDSNTPMDDKDAADMICRPSFSTADQVTELSGRGVGMDVVRNSVLSMGGRFDIASRPGRGLRVVIQLPTSVSTASVLIVEAGNDKFSIPVDLMDDVAIIKGENLKLARNNGYVQVGDSRVQFGNLADLMGIPHKIQPIKQDHAHIMLLREGNRKIAIEVNRLVQITEVPLRPLSKIWQNNPGIVGATLLSDGSASFLVDPLRMPWSFRKISDVIPEKEKIKSNPVVLIVDDSITVRKVTSQFLERNGYDYLTAKNGLEALEILASTTPDVMFLDVEMPKMDGFDCAKNVRENPRTKNLPIIMITSRTAEKHRERAMSLGVNEYLGKPFNEDEVLSLLKNYAPKKIY